MPTSGLSVGLSVTALNPHPIHTHALASGCVQRLIQPRPFLCVNWETLLGSPSRGCFRSWCLPPKRNAVTPDLYAQLAALFCFDPGL